MTTTVDGTLGVLTTIVSASGNITGGNIITAGIVSSTGNITVGNVLAGNYYYSNATPFTSGITVGKSLAITLIFGG